MTLKNLMVYGIVLLAMLFWSMTYIWYKIVFTVLNPISVMTIRLGFSAVFMYVFTRVVGKWQTPSKKDSYWFIALSFFQPFLYFLAESYGVRLVSSTISAVIISTIPVFTPITAFLFLSYKISKLNILGILVSFFGVLIVVLGKDLHFEGSTLGIAILFGAVLSALAYGILIVRLTHKYNSFTIITIQNIVGFAFFLPLFMLFDYHNFVNAQFNQKIILNLLYLSLFGSSIAYVFFTYAIKNLGLSTSSLFTNTIPVFTAILSYYLLGESLSYLKIGGICLVISGLLLCQIKFKNVFKYFH